MLSDRRVNEEGDESEDECALPRVKIEKRLQISNSRSGLGYDQVKGSMNGDNSPTKDLELYKEQREREN